jgi:hypothetical protein
VKPEEEHPRLRIEQIENILKQREADESYRQLLLAADGFFRSNNLSQARDEYQKALEIKPEEAYPRSQIERIDETLQKLAQRTAPLQQPENVVTRETDAVTQAPVVTPSVRRTVSDELAELYQSFITVADESFEREEYNVSRAWYYKALEVIPAEQYPRSQIAEINRILSSLQLSQRDREFQQYINQGDEAFRNEELAVARGWYNRALTIRSNDIYANSQINEIQQVINSRLQGGTDRVFNDYLREGDKAYDNKEFSVARVWYQRALQLKPGDSQPKEKLELVRKVLVGQ